MQGAKFVCEIPRAAGKCVGTASTEHGIIIACEFAVYLYSADNTLTEIVPFEPPAPGLFK